MVNSFERTVDLTHRALDAASLRETVLANNLANAEVPNFKRSDVNFETYLKKALDSERAKPSVELKRTDSRHFTNWTPIDYRTVQPRRVLDYLSTAKNNGNNVDAEQEAQLHVKNELVYSLLAQSLAFEFNQVESVLRG